MPATPYAAIATIPTPEGIVYVRKTWAAKQQSFLLVLDGPNAALRLLLPDWRPRTPNSTRTQVTPPQPATLTAEIMAFSETQLPVWFARAAGRNPTTASKLSTVGDCIKAIEKEIAPTIRPSSLAAYRKQWKRIGRIIPVTTKLVNLNREKVQAMVGKMAARGAAATSIRNAITALHRALGPAIEVGAVNVSIFQKLSLPRPVARPRQHLTREQRDHVLAVAATQGRDIHLLVAIGLLAGLRKSEVLALTWRQVDLDAKLLKVQNTATFKTKSGRNRCVPICAHLATILTNYRPAEVDPTIFVIKPDKKPRPGQQRWVFTKSLRRVARNAGVPWLTPHGLRRAFATHAVAGGVSIYKIKTWLGHASTLVSERYVADLNQFDADVERIG